MLILGIDTSGKSGGITLAEGDGRSFRAFESSPIAGGTFSAQLVPSVASLLEKHGFTAGDLDGFAVASGPGSFTGLRVGLSAVKGLAEVLGKPIATVSLLEAMVVESNQRGHVAAALDAGRSEIFFGLYEVSPDSARMIQESLLSQAEFVERLRLHPGLGLHLHLHLHPGDRGDADLGNADLAAIVSCEDSVFAVASAAGLQSPIAVVEKPGSEMIARIGLRKLLAGETVSVEALDANYIRRSDAEIFAKAKR